MKKLFWSAVLLTLAAHRILAGEPLKVTNVAWTTSQFNPAVGKKVSLTFQLNVPANTAVNVLDRRGLTVRHIVMTSKLQSGQHEAIWDGRDDRGVIVPNGAYFPEIDARSRRQHVVVQPAVDTGTVEKIQVRYYDRTTGVVAYDLKSPSLVTMVGTAMDASGAPISMSITDEEPRSGGSVIEHWNGYDSTGQTFLPSLQGFSIEIRAISLPGLAVISYGARGDSVPSTPGDVAPRKAGEANPHSDRSETKENAHATK